VQSAHVILSVHDGLNLIIGWIAKELKMADKRRERRAQNPDYVHIMHFDVLSGI
jgi:hypothetical protein